MMRRRHAPTRLCSPCLPHFRKRAFSHVRTCVYHGFNLDSHLFISRAHTHVHSHTHTLRRENKGVWDYFNKSKLVALGKHYAAYGAANGGLNGGAAELSERTLREWYLRPWRAFAKAGGKGAMTSHNTILGQPAHANSYVPVSMDTYQLKLLHQWFN